MAGSGLEVVVGTPSSSQDSLELPFLEGLVEAVTQMKASRPDIVRGIPVFRVLQRMPRKWLAGERTTFYGLSQVEKHLDEFWSHSWRTMAWLKYVDILFLNNGFPAFVVATLCALGAFSLALSGIVPVHHAPAEISIATAWCTIAGTLGYYVTLFLWQSRRPFYSLEAIAWGYLVKVVVLQN